MYLNSLTTMKNEKPMQRIFPWLYACFQVQSICAPACQELEGCWTLYPGLVGRRAGPSQNQRCLCIPLSVTGMIKHKNHTDH